MSAIYKLFIQTFMSLTRNKNKIDKNAIQTLGFPLCMLCIHENIHNKSKVFSVRDPICGSDLRIERNASGCCLCYYVGRETGSPRE